MVLRYDFGRVQCRITCLLKRIGSHNTIVAQGGAGTLKI